MWDINTFVKFNLSLSMQRYLFINAITENDYQILKEQYGISAIKNNLQLCHSVPQVSNRLSCD